MRIVRTLESQAVKRMEADMRRRSATTTNQMRHATQASRLNVARPTNHSGTATQQPFRHATPRPAQRQLTPRERLSVGANATRQAHAPQPHRHTHAPRQSFGEADTQRQPRITASSLSHPQHCDYSYRSRNFDASTHHDTFVTRVGRFMRQHRAGRAMAFVLLALTVFVCVNRLTALELQKGDGGLFGLFDGTPAAAAGGSSARSQQEAPPVSTPKKDWKLGTMPCLYQTDRAWSAEPYGNDHIETSGCGPTALSMAYVQLTGKRDADPAAMARFATRNGSLERGLTTWTLMTEGAQQLGLHSKELPADADLLRAELEAGHPVIATVGPGDFTETGHFLAIAGMTADGQLEVHDPNSEKNTRMTWDVQRVLGQCRNLWAFSV